jgi:hypothetical protein
VYLSFFLFNDLYYFVDEFFSIVVNLSHIFFWVFMFLKFINTHKVIDILNL